jgi:putative DNA primase/helicase
MPNITISSDTIEQSLITAMDCIPAENRDDWLRVGMALQAELGDAGFAYWDQWSQSADSYNSKACESAWRSFHGDGITVGTLYHLAKQHGWTPDKSVVRRMTAPRIAPSKKRSKTRLYALELWMAANRDDQYVATHPYAQRKGIYCAGGAGRAEATGRLIGKKVDCLIVPQRTLENKVVGVEVIAPDGTKQTFGNKGILILGNDLDADVPQLVCEGWATGFRLLHIMKNAAIYCCFGKGTLEKTARKIAEEYPDRKVRIMAEGDN